MKIVIAALASLAFAASAIAAVPSTPVEKKPTIKTVGLPELAYGSARGHAASAKGTAKTGGKGTK